MNDHSRAKQFLAFEALKGLDKALKEKEKMLVEKKLFSKDDQENLSYKISQLKIGMIITLIYYKDYQYLRIEGMITNIDYLNKIIYIIKEKISVNNIISIQGENINDLNEF